MFSLLWWFFNFLCLLLALCVGNASGNPSLNTLYWLWLYRSHFLLLLRSMDLSSKYRESCSFRLHKYCRRYLLFFLPSFSFTLITSADVIERQYCEMQTRKNKYNSVSHYFINIFEVKLYLIKFLVYSQSCPRVVFNWKRKNNAIFK